MDAILEQVLIGSLSIVIGALLLAVIWKLVRLVAKLIRWAWRTLKTRRRSGVDVVTVPHHGSHNLDLDPMVAGPLREWNKLWSDDLRRRKLPMRLRPSARF